MNEKNIDHLMATPKKEEVDFFGQKLDTKIITEKIVEKSKNEQTGEASIEISSNPSEKEFLNIKTLGINSRNSSIRKLVSIEKNVSITLDSIEEYITEDLIKKYGDQPNLKGLKKEIINKILKLGLKNLGFEVE